MDIQKKKYFFDHLPKTAGSSLYAAFESLLGSSNISPMLGSTHRRACAECRDYTMIRGHFWFLPGEEFDPARYYITVLRDPIDRAISNFFFLYDEKGIGGYAETAAKTVNDIHEYVFSDDPAVLEVISNFQTRHFMQIGWDGSSELSEKEQLELAKQALERYDVVGVYEYLQDVMDVVCYECGLPAVIELPRLNVTASRPSSRRLAPETMERLETLNRADIELHRFATELFLKHRRRIMIGCIKSRVAEGSNDHREECSSADTHQPPTLKESSLLADGDGTSRRPVEYGIGGMKITEVVVFGALSKKNLVWGGEKVTVRITFNALVECDQLTVGFSIHDKSGVLVYGTNTLHLMHWLKIVSVGTYYVDYTFRNILPYGDYTVNAALHSGAEHLSKCYHWKDDATSFFVVGNLDFTFVGIANLSATVGFGVVDGEATGIESVGARIEGLRPFRVTTDIVPLTEFKAKIRPLTAIESLSPWEVIIVYVEVTNEGSEVWPACGPNPVNLSYHWRDAEGAVVVHEGLRTPLPHDVGPNETLRVAATVKAPAKEGTTFLDLTLVQECVAWFDQHGLNVETIPVEIRNR